jgi:hypothetical protein
VGRERGDMMGEERQESDTFSTSEGNGIWSLLWRNDPGVATKEEEKV